jgi:hypothetical protein
MKLPHLLLTKIVCLAFLTTSALPVFAKPQSQPFLLAATDDTTAIINLIKDWGVVQDVLIIDNYAAVSYAFGQNGGEVTFKRQNGKWNIIDGGKQEGNCQDINCLVAKGVPNSIATQFINYLQDYRRPERELTSFRQSWAKKNRNIAPFLGYWRNMDYYSGSSSSKIAISVWPSSVANRVCLVEISKNSQFVKIGVSSGNKIKFNNLLFTHGNDADGEYISSGRNKDYVINPRPLNTWYFSTATRKQLKDAGCTSSLPSR